jgi:hypothetical protein
MASMRQQANPRPPRSEPEETSETSAPELERPQTPSPIDPSHSTDDSTPASNDISAPGSGARKQLERELSHQITDAESRESPQHNDEEEPRKCWICFTDETEDTPMSSEWRSPCPCALTAHESCLLDWIADVQAPADRSRGFTNKKILCPQCKTEIHVERPENLIVKAAQACEQGMARALIPGLITIFSGSMWTGCMVYGMSTIYLIFGTVDGNTILGRPALMDHGGFEVSLPDARFLFRLLLPFTSPLGGWSWRLGLGVPLIPVGLVLSRTKWGKIALPAISILFLGDGEEQSWFRNATWPPDAAATFTILPLVRTAYYELYDYFFAGLERQWYNELSTRGGDDDNGDEVRFGDDGEDHDHDHDNEEMVLEVNLELDLLDEEDAELEEAVVQEVEALADGGLPDGQEIPLMPDQGQEDGAPIPAAAPGPLHEQRGNGLVLSAARIADTIIGALLFPSVSAAMGHLLKISLPRSWTAGTWATGRTGLLQEKWGRAVVGGCAFVVMKDALMLYVKWKTAQTHRRRTVLNYDRKKAAVV